MSLHDYLSADEADQMQRELVRDIDKSEARIQAQIDELKRRSSANHIRPELDRVWNEIHEMSVMLGKLSRIIERHTASIEDLSL